jgi:hypothetical protein
MIRTQWAALRKARSVNQTSSSYVAKAPMATAPLDDAASATGQASIDMVGASGNTANGVMILPYGVGADNTTFSFRVLGWKLFGPVNDPDTLIWVGPIMLGEFDCIIDSDLVGLAGRRIVATECFCDIIALNGTSGNANVSHEIVSPADGLNMAHVILDTKGCDRIELSFKKGTATSCNALVSQL